jgi:hypothetical protein
LKKKYKNFSLYWDRTNDLQVNSLTRYHLRQQGSCYFLKN